MTSNTVLARLMEDAAASSGPGLIKRLADTKRAIQSDPSCAGQYKFLGELIAPLVELLPTLSEYTVMPQPEELRKPKTASPGLEKAPEPLPRREVALHNPAVLFMSEYYCDVYEAKIEGRPTPQPCEQLNDQEYDMMLTAVENMSIAWAGKPDATPIELAKNLIVYSVLRDDELKEIVLKSAWNIVEANLGCIQELQQWREQSKG